MAIMRDAEDAVSAAMPYRGEYRTRARNVELVLQSDGIRKMLFAANVGNEEARFSIEELGGSHLHVLWGAERGATEDPQRVCMPCHSIFIWEVQKP